MSEAGNVTIVLSCDKATYTQAMNEAQRQLDKFKGKSSSVARGMKNDARSAREAMMVFQGGSYQMAMAAGDLIGKSKTLSKALEMAFPVIGVAAFGAVIAQVGMKVVTFIEQARKMPGVIKSGFDTLNTSAQLSADNLGLTNAKLANQIDLLEGKPTNNLQEALYEARVEADKLAQSLVNDNNKITQLLTKDKIGFFAGMMTGQARTTPDAGAINSYDSQLEDLGFRYKDAVRGGHKERAAKLLQQIHAKQQSAIQWSSNELKKAESAQKFYKNTPAYDISPAQYFNGDYRDQTGRITLLQGFRSQLQATVDLQDEQSQNAKDQLQLHKLQNHQKQVARLKRQHDTWAKAHNKTIKYMIMGIKPPTPTNAQETAALDQNPDNIRNMQYRDLSKVDSAFLSTQGRAAATYAHGLRQSINIRQQNGFALQNQAIHANFAAGKITVLQAAEQSATLHAEEYTAALAKLHRQLRAISNDPALTRLERQALTSSLMDNIYSLKGKRMLQSWNDRNAIYNSTVHGALHSSFQAYAAHATNTPAQVSGLLMGGIQSVNGALATSMMAHAYTGREYRRNIANSLSGAARGMGTHLLNTAFQHIEGGVIGKFLGNKHKPTGASGDPLYVRIAHGATGAAGAIGHLFSGHGKIGGFFGHLFQGFFANGGDVMANRPAIIGERGPELFVPRTAGTIVPHHSLVSGGSGVQIHNHIDARGAHDPAAVEASVHRAMHQLAGPMSAVALQTQHEHRLRTPGMRG